MQTQLNVPCTPSSPTNQTSQSNKNKKVEQKAHMKVSEDKTHIFPPHVQKTRSTKIKTVSSEEKIQTELHVRLPTQPLFVKGIRKSLTASFSILVFHTNLREFPLQEAHLAQKNPQHSSKRNPFLHDALQFNLRLLISLQSYADWEPGKRNEKSQVTANATQFEGDSTSLLQLEVDVVSMLFHINIK